MSTQMEKLKGQAKETAGKVTGSDELAREGQHQQEKAEKKEEAEALKDAAETKEKKAAGHASAESSHQG